MNYELMRKSLESKYSSNEINVFWLQRWLGGYDDVFGKMAPKHAVVQYKISRRDMGRRAASLR